MYKIKLTYKDLSLEIESPTPTLAESDQYCRFITDLIKDYDKIENRTEEVVEKQTPIHYNYTHVRTEDNHPVIRDRLPNRHSNEVDLASLNVQTGTSTAHSHFRCPDCGQSAVLYANGQPVVRDIVNGQDCFSVDFDKNSSLQLSYEHACQNSGEQVRFMVGEGLESECPSCGGVHPTQTFVDAYYNPLNYFETEDLCPLCGKELLLETSSGTTYLSCEEPCVFKKAVQKD